MQTFYLFVAGLHFFSWAFLSLEPAAFSVKTIPQTRNPKVTRPHFPPMSLTLQVTSCFHAYIHVLFFQFTLSVFLCHILCCFLILPIYCWMHRLFWLPHMFLPLLLIHFMCSYSLSNTHKSRLIHCAHDGLETTCWDGERSLPVSVMLCVYTFLLVWSDLR